jgi:hypothetical protein
VESERFSGLVGEVAAGRRGRAGAARLRLEEGAPENLSIKLKNYSR